MLSSYAPVLISLAVAVAFPIGLMAAASFLGPRVRHRPKFEPYECGVPPVGTRQDLLPVRFYRTAIIFLIFDVEAAFLFPWAVLFRHKFREWGAIFLVGELLLFLAVLIAGYVYAWRSGALEWD